MKQIIECVPNFSEGRNPEVIQAIVSEIQSVDGVKVLNVDPGKATNRTVVTIAGEPKQVVQAAFLGIKKASELIDMRKHKGEHPRMGATDVCPFIPVSNITMEETVVYAKQLAEKVGEELAIPVYLYEEAQSNKKRSNLSVIRGGEYEGFFDKIKKPEWKPDFGPAVYSATSGATVIGARDFLIAYNINLNTRSTRIANRIAFDVREAGRVKRKGNPITGPVETDENGEAIRIPGTLKHVKAIGWYIEEYKVAQISMNLTNFRETPVHVAFDEVCNKAIERGVRVTGSELVGLIPLKAMLDAGKYFLAKQGRSLGVPDDELIHIAVKSMGLDELGPFNPQERIIEYVLESASSSRLVSMPVRAFLNLTASDSPAPGGGSVAALCGALGTALGSMMANLSADKRGWEDKTAIFSKKAESLIDIQNQLDKLIDADTLAFDAIMEAIRMPKDSKEQQDLRSKTIEEASKHATEVPFKTLELSAKAVPVVAELAQSGNPNSLSDAGAGLACLQTAMRAAWMNVMINAKGLDDKKWAEDIRDRANTLLNKGMSEADIALKEIDNRLVF